MFECPHCNKKSDEEKEESFISNNDEDLKKYKKSLKDRTNTK